MLVVCLYPRAFREESPLRTSRYKSHSYRIGGLVMLLKKAILMLKFVLLVVTNRIGFKVYLSSEVLYVK